MGCSCWLLTVNNKIFGLYPRHLRPSTNIHEAVIGQCINLKVVRDQEMKDVAREHSSSWVLCLELCKADR